MIEFYAQARAVHIGAVLCSGTLFALCFVAALTVFVAMIGIARAHQPLGWFAAAFVGNVGGTVGSAVGARA